MPHTVWNLGALAATARVQPRTFIAGIEPARDIFIGRAREPKKMLVILDAWLEVNDVLGTTDDLNKGKYSLALGKDPLNAALLLPVGTVTLPGNGASIVDHEQVEDFRAQGTMWAVKEIAIDFLEFGNVSVDADVHMDWTVAPVDWWTWFASWDSLEAFPDGSLVDGERAYA